MSNKTSVNMNEKPFEMPRIDGASGQSVIPELVDELEYDSAQMDPWDEVFCRLVAGGTSGSEALMRARPGSLKPQSAKVSASRLLNPKVLTNANRLAYIKLLRKRYAQNLDMNNERTLLELRRIAYGNYQDFYDESGGIIPIHQLPPHVAACITGVDKSGKYRTDKGSCLLNLAKIQGLLKDSVEVTGKDGKPIEHTVGGLLNEVMGTTRDLVQS